MGGYDRTVIMLISFGFVEWLSKKSERKLTMSHVMLLAKEFEVINVGGISSSQMLDLSTNLIFYLSTEKPDTNRSLIC